MFQWGKITEPLQQRTETRSKRPIADVVPEDSDDPRIIKRMRLQAGGTLLLVRSKRKVLAPTGTVPSPVPVASTVAFSPTDIVNIPNANPVVSQQGSPQTITAPVPTRSSPFAGPDNIDPSFTAAPVRSPIVPKSRKLVGRQQAKEVPRKVRNSVTFLLVAVLTSP